MELPGHCGACGAAAATRMYRTNIPFFKACPEASQCAWKRWYAWNSQYQFAKQDYSAETGPIKQCTACLYQLNVADV